ncbi:unnamed protein product [Cladocopium goreaui]|uniref:Uncharacterized protein n=1 Tax=Cladocopium goreaui TaxID=2562237 RepID=A0A9P1BXZ4_9DINO|nr:unnamed protein product [Cladocopium goreaui]
MPLTEAAELPCAHHGGDVCLGPGCCLSGVCQGRTALHLAANEVSGPSNIMRMLLEARASLMAKDVTGLTPMTLACQSNCQEAVAVLQSVMADQAEKFKDEAREEWNKFVFEIKALWESNKLKQVLEIQEQRFGKEDRDTLSTKIDLAAVLQQQHLCSAQGMKYKAWHREQLRGVSCACQFWLVMTINEAVEPSSKRSGE